MMPAPSPQKSETRLGGPEVLAPPNRPEDANPRVDPKLWDFEKPLMLTEPSMMQIQTLWLILDKTGDERISYEDFLALAGGHGETDQKRAIAKWQEMAKFFDTDHSGDVTPFEFIDGFKRKAMSEELDWEGIQSMPKKTYLDVQAQYNESVNRRLQNLVKKAHAFLAQDAAPPGTVIKLSPLWNEHRSTRKISKDLTEQLLINTENQEKIENIFKHLDETKDGVLTKEDFRSTTEGKVSRYSFWDQLRAELDENQDGHISDVEFVLGIKKVVLKQPQLPPTSRPADHSQAMTMLNEALNRSLKKWLAEFAQKYGIDTKGE